MNRRKMITGLASMLTSPAIVPYANLMPVKASRDWILDGTVYRRGSSIIIPFLVADNGVLRWWTKLPAGLDEIVPSDVNEVSTLIRSNGQQVAFWNSPPQKWGAL